MNIVLPQSSPGQVVLSVFEGDPVNLTVTFTAPATETITNVTLNVSARGNQTTSIVTKSNTGSVTVTGSFTEIFNQQSFRVLDWKNDTGYVLPKIYTMYTSLSAVQADMNWDNLIAFNPDPRATVPVTFSGVITTTKPNETMPTMPIITNYNYSFVINVNQQFDNNKTVVEMLVSRSAEE